MNAAPVAYRRGPAGHSEATRFREMRRPNTSEVQRATTSKVVVAITSQVPHRMARSPRAAATMKQAARDRLLRSLSALSIRSPSMGLALLALGLEIVGGREEVADCGTFDWASDEGAAVMLPVEAEALEHGTAVTAAGAWSGLAVLGLLFGHGAARFSR